MSGATFNLFVYGTLRGEAAPLLAGAERLGPARVEGALYDIDGRYPALMLAGRGVVEGEVYRCPAELLPRLDEYEGVEEGLFRRVGVRVGELACWTYVAGPSLARRLTAENRVVGGRWEGG